MSKPNYEFWDGQNEFTLLVAAALCCDLEPENWTRENPIPIKVREMMKRLLKEVPYRDESKRIAKDNWATGIKSERRIQGDKVFTRKDLKAWSQTTDLNIPFLLSPDERDEGGKVLREDTKESLLSTIALLGHIVADKAGPRGIYAGKPNQSFLAELIKKKADELNLEDSVATSFSSLQGRLKEAFELLRELQRKSSNV